MTKKKVGKKQAKAILAELSADFDRRLASFNDPGIRDRVETVMVAKGRAKRRGKAGPSF